jgi:hypothetical protein
MGKTLSKTVSVDGVVYPAGTELPDGVKVENERAFEEDEQPTPAEQIQAAEDAALEAQEARAKAAEDAEKDSAPAKPAARPAARK